MVSVQKGDFIYVCDPDAKIEPDDFYLAWITNYYDAPHERWVQYCAGTCGLNGTKQMKVVAVTFQHLAFVL